VGADTDRVVWRIKAETLVERSTGDRSQVVGVGGLAGDGEPVDGLVESIRIRQAKTVRIWKSLTANSSTSARPMIPSVWD
jgi:hypothetical protein